MLSRALRLLSRCRSAAIMLSGDMAAAVAAAAAAAAALAGDDALVLAGDASRTSAARTGGATARPDVARLSAARVKSTRRAAIISRRGVSPAAGVVGPAGGAPRLVGCGVAPLPPCTATPPPGVAAAARSGPGEAGDGGGARIAAAAAGVEEEAAGDEGESLRRRLPGEKAAMAFSMPCGGLGDDGDGDEGEPRLPRRLPSEKASMAFSRPCGGLGDCDAGGDGSGVAAEPMQAAAGAAEMGVQTSCSAAEGTCGVHMMRRRGGVARPRLPPAASAVPSKNAVARGWRGLTGV